MMLVQNLTSKIKSTVLRKGNFKLFCKIPLKHKVEVRYRCTHS